MWMEVRLTESESCRLVPGTVGWVTTTTATRPRAKLSMFNVRIGTEIAHLRFENRRLIKRLGTTTWSAPPQHLHIHRNF